MVGERGKWSEGRRVSSSETQPERNVPPPSRRRTPSAPAASRRMPTRDERAVGGAEREPSRGDSVTGQPVQRSKMRVGHGRIGNVRSVLRLAMREARIPMSARKWFNSHFDFHDRMACVSAAREQGSRDQCQSNGKVRRGFVDHSC